MMGADDNFGVCAFLWKFCSQLVPCGSSYDCADSNHICVRHHRCNNSPVCYPLSMINENICPSLSTIINETTTTTATTSKFNKWKQEGITIAGENGRGNELNQFDSTDGIFIDKSQNIFIADQWNHRIIQWKLNETKGKITAGGNESGNRIDQLYLPKDVIVDQENHSLIITDQGNRRVVRWFLNKNQQEILIENIECWGLAMDKYGYLYVSDQEKNEVRRWKMDEIKGKEGELVAGGNGEGKQIHQFDLATFIFVDNEQSIYVSDLNNHRVMKWKKNAKKGIIVAGGNGRGNQLNQLARPAGIIVDDYGQIYIADCKNHRIIRWNEGAKEGEIIIGGNNSTNQSFYPKDLSFDVEGNLYVADAGNQRIQRFDLI